MAVKLGPVNSRGNRKGVQHCFANRRGKTALGKVFLAGTPVVHISSTRSTGETFIFLPSELERVLRSRPTAMGKSIRPHTPSPRPKKKP